MRVLFTTQPGGTILQLMTPLAWALRAAGHEVRVASQPAFAEVITQAGLTAVAVGVDRYPMRMMAERDGTAAEEPSTASMYLAEPYDVAELPPDQVSWDALASRFDAEYVNWWHRMDNFPLVPDLVAFARAWKPDLVIWEPLTQAGAIAAKAVGAAHARLLWSVDFYGVIRDHYLRLKREQPASARTDPMAEWLADSVARYGAEYSEDLTCGHFTIDQLPAPLRLSADLNYVPMRYVPYGGPAVVPKWLWTPPDRPRIALTLGQSIVNERAGGYVVRVQDVLDSLADLDVEVVATIADKERDKLDRIPGNATIVPYVPLQALAPTCSAVIHHAGIGTMCTTTLHGVPQLTLPWDFDEPALARRFAEHGAGIAEHATLATGPSVRDNVVRLLEEPAFRQRTEDLRAEMLAMPTPAEVVAQLEELTAKHRDPLW